MLYEWRFGGAALPKHAKKASRKKKDRKRRADGLMRHQ
jgi:hypothetical protein